MPTSTFISARPAIKVDGAGNDDMEQALTGMVVSLPLNGIAHAELILTNWGPAGSDATTTFMFQDVELGKTLDVAMASSDGQGKSETVFSGEITAIEERYGSGAPQLVILAQDKLHRLARKRQSRAYDKQSPDDIVSSIAGDAGLQADANVSSVSATFHQINESNLAFLMRVLGYFDIAIRLEGNVLRARPEEGGAKPVELNVQDSALDVRLIADLNHQYSSTQVLGFNPDTGDPVSHTESALSSPPAGTTAYETLNQLGWPGKEVVAQPFPASNGLAGGFAQGHFNRSANRFISGEIRCLGEPGLRSGREIELSGVSDRMAGTYSVVHCVHRFDSTSGYQTHVRVNRSGWKV